MTTRKPRFILIAFIFFVTFQVGAFIYLQYLHTAALAANGSVPDFSKFGLTLQVPIPGFDNISSAGVSCSMDAQGNASSCSVGWMANYIKAIYNYSLGAVGIAATVALMIGGVIWLTAGGSSGQVGNAKEWIKASITGLVVALTSFMMLNVINPSLTKLNPISMGIVQKVDINLMSGDNNPALLSEPGGFNMEGFNNISFTERALNDLKSGKLSQETMNLLKALEASGAKVTISCVITGHSVNVAGTNSPSQHTLGNAIDIRGTPDNLATAAQYYYNNYRSSIGQLIYYPPGGNSSWNLYNGNYHVYNPGTQKDHPTHIHLAGRPLR